MTCYMTIITIAAEVITYYSHLLVTKKWYFVKKKNGSDSGTVARQMFEITLITPSKP